MDCKGSVRAETGENGESNGEMDVWRCVELEDERMLK
jgi:hypothetical protein